MSTGTEEARGSLPLNIIGETIGIFAFVGIGIGLTGGIAISQLGSGGAGGAIISGILILVILTVAFLLGPIVGMTTGLRTGEQRGRTSESYLAGLVGSVAGYLVMMIIVLLTLSVIVAVVMGDGGSGSTAAQSATSTTTSSSGGFPIGDYIVPVFAVAIPTGLTGIGGVFFGGSEQTTTAGESVTLPWKYVGVGFVVIALIVAGLIVVPGLLSPSPQQLEVTGDASTSQTELYALATVENPTGSEISTTLTIEVVIDGQVLTTTDEDITVSANDETRINVVVATVNDMTNQEIRAVSNGNYQLHYIINGETVETFEA